MSMLSRAVKFAQQYYPNTVSKFSKCLLDIAYSPDFRVVPLSKSVHQMQWS